MPLYEYECQQCHRHTEKIQKFSDPEITVCPHCGGKLERVISAPAIAFKGGGWYADGYGNKKSVGASGESKASGSKSGEGKSDVGGAKSTDSSSGAASSAPAAPSAAPVSSTSTTGTK